MNMIGNIRQLLKQADDGKFAIPAFNYSDEWELYGIVAAAEELRSPIIIATIGQVTQAHGFEYLSSLGNIIAKRASVPIVNHLDHCIDEEKCKQAIDAGYRSVMIDGSPLPLEDNMALTRTIVEYAAPHGVAVEAEVGRICGSNAEGTYTGKDFLVELESAVKMAQCADIASLAIGIGTAHGFYEEKPELNFKRLCEVNEAIDTPLVLHGCSGLPAEDVQKAIQLGINKVNIGTQLHYAYLQELQAVLKRDPETTSIITTMKPVVERVKHQVMECIKMCMSDNKA